TALEAEGILCSLRDEHTVLMQWAWSRAVGGIKLQVPESQLQQAEALLGQMEANAAAEQETPGFIDEDTSQLNPDNRICIHCGSKNTRQENFDKVPAFLSWILVGFPIFFKSRKWHCFHCGEKF